MQVNYPIISSDSHIAEAPNTYTDYIEPEWRDVAPHVIETEDKGDLYVIDGMKRTIQMGLIDAAGKAPEELNPKGNWDRRSPSASDSTDRIPDQNRDGHSADVI